MIDAIFRALPDWAVSILCVALIWYGAHYIFLADVALRGDLKIIRADTSMSESFKSCAISVLQNWVSANRGEYALHTATFTLVPSEDSLIARMNADTAVAVQACRG